MVAAHSGARTEEAGVLPRAVAAPAGAHLTGLWQWTASARLLGKYEQAMVVSNSFQDNAGATCVFYAVLNNRDNRWLIDRHGRTSANLVSRLMEGFKIHRAVKFDVVGELVGDGARRVVPR